MPSHTLSFKSPLQRFQEFFPTSRLNSILPLNVFGCTIFVRIHHKKLDPRALECVFIAYPPTQKGYKCYDPTTIKVFVSIDVTFFEQTPYFQKPLFQGENSSKDQFISFTISHYERILNTKPPPPCCSNMPCMKENLNSRGDVEKRNDREIGILKEAKNKVHGDLHT